ncbi:MAG: hypothetical protein AAFX81_13410 [Pseudomonadota bacterium]
MGIVTFDTNVLKTVDIEKMVDLTVNKVVNSSVNLEGSLATAEASADAIEFENNLAETDTFAQVSSLGAFSFSESLAAGNDPVVPEPEVVTQQINVVYVVDATGSTAFAWTSEAPNRFDGIDENGDPFTFAEEQNPNPSSPPDDNQQSGNDPGDAIDGEIAALKNLTNDLVLDANQAILDAAAVGTLLTVDLNVVVVRVFDENAEVVRDDVTGNVIIFNPLLESDRDALFAELEDTGSSGDTNLGAGLDGEPPDGEGVGDGAINALDAIPDNPADPDGIDFFLYFITDADTLQLVTPPEVADAVANLDAFAPGIIREAWFVENQRVADGDDGAEIAVTELNEISGPEQGGFETLETVADLTFDFVIPIA